MRRGFAAAAALAMACGNQADSGTAGLSVECETVSCPTADSEEASEGSRFSSVTCRWECTDHGGNPRAVTSTWTREAGECFALTNQDVQPCAL